jgi:hypothetical protein
VIQNGSERTKKIILRSSDVPEEEILLLTRWNQPTLLLVILHILELMSVEESVSKNSTVIPAQISYADNEKSTTYRNVPLTYTVNIRDHEYRILSSDNKRTCNRFVSLAASFRHTCFLI